MANKIPKVVRRDVRKLAYARCDEYGYAVRSRTENTVFMNSLVDVPEIGGRLREYMTSEEVRTYIKDTLLNAYSKALVKKKLDSTDPLVVISGLYGVDTTFVGKLEDTFICRASNNSVYLFQSGTLLKWETALRKLLECVAANPALTTNSTSLNMCLLLAVTNDELSFGDKQQIETALGYIGVKVYFAK